MLLEGMATFSKAIIDSSVKLITGYPGGPATDILEKTRQFNIKDTTVNWGVNEKQAVALAVGFSMVGKRAAVVMKHVGLNVASDAVIGAALNGTKGGLVFFIGDDPGALMSQNEQDSRAYQRLFNIPILEPNSTKMAYKVTQSAYDISERFRVPVIVRFTNKMKNLKDNVSVSLKKSQVSFSNFSGSKRWLPVNPPQKHLQLYKKMANVKNYVSDFEFNNTEFTSSTKHIGIITSGPVVNMLKNELSNSSKQPSLLNLSTVYPLPTSLLQEFASGMDQLLIVEEGEPIIENAFNRILSEKKTRIFGRLSGHLPYQGQLNKKDIKRALKAFFEQKKDYKKNEKNIKPTAPWVDVKDCPIKKGHKIMKEVLEPIRDQSIVVGDTGCVGWGFSKNYNTTDAFLCMGTSTSVAGGISLSQPNLHSVAIMGDSSFLHSGIQSLLNAIYNKTDVLFIIFDNGRTGETGGQSNPNSGINFMGEDTQDIELENLVKNCKPDYFMSINVFNKSKVKKTISKYLDTIGVQVLILQGECPNDCPKIKRKT